MIDYDKQDADPIVAEVRRAREEILAEHNYDLRKIIDNMQQRQVRNRSNYVQPPVRQANPSRRKKAG